MPSLVLFRRVYLLLVMVQLFLSGGVSVSACSISCSSCCRSNDTHIAWPHQQHQQQLQQQRRGLSTLTMTKTTQTSCCVWEKRARAEQAALTYLRRNIMKFDVPKFETLGFLVNDNNNYSNDDSAASGNATTTTTTTTTTPPLPPDGLSNGIVGPTVTLALNTKVNYTWADMLPKEIFYEYVLNYANTNEARTNWRPYLTPVVESILQQRQRDEYTIKSLNSISHVVQLLNTHLWKALALPPRHLNNRKNNYHAQDDSDNSIIFVSGQTPLIYDPMSVILFGYGSCTGLAILFVNALRAAGVAARVAGTPAWNNNMTQGNHNWVEVYNPLLITNSHTNHNHDEYYHDENNNKNDNNSYDDSKNHNLHHDSWYFMEPSPKQNVIDTLERNPCERWFCHADRFGITNVYSARLDQSTATKTTKTNHSYYPLAWERNCTDVPGLDRTEYYKRICSQCP